MLMPDLCVCSWLSTAKSGLQFIPSITAHWSGIKLVISARKWQTAHLQNVLADIQGMALMPLAPLVINRLPHHDCKGCTHLVKNPQLHVGMHWVHTIWRGLWIKVGGPRPSFKSAHWPKSAGCGDCRAQADHKTSKETKAAFSLPKGEHLISEQAQVTGQSLYICFGP